MKTSIFTLAAFTALSSLSLIPEAKAGALETWSESRCRGYLISKANRQYSNKAYYAEQYGGLRSKERLQDQAELRDDRINEANTMADPCGEVKSFYAGDIEEEQSREREKEKAIQAEKEHEEMEEAKSLVHPPVSY